MPAFKVWCDRRERKKCIVADTFEVLLSKVRSKFATDSDTIKLVLEEDGTDIEDDEVLQLFKDKVLMVLKENEEWVTVLSQDHGVPSPQRPPVENISHSPPRHQVLQAMNSQALNWGHTFDIPWQKIRTELLEKLEKSKGRETEAKMKLLKTEFSEVMRTVVPEMRTKTKYPGREVMCTVAERMIQKYKVLADLDEDGKHIGKGYASVALKLEEHNHYLNRPNNNTSLITIVTSTLGTDGRRKRKKDKKSALSGTINWQPDYDNDETEKTQNEKKKWMISEARKGENDRDKDTIKKYMESTYPSQRLFLNSGDATVEALKNEWPILLETPFLLRHCEKLVTSFSSDFNFWSLEKLNKIIYFMEGIITLEKAKAILEKNQDLKETKMKKAEDGTKIINCAKNSQAVGAVLLLMHKFNEKESNLLFVHKADGATRDEILASPRSPSPCIVVVGRDVYEGTTHYVVAENTIVSAHPKVSDALTVTYCLIFLFNMKYPKPIGHTWEFMQRYFFKNNPVEGSKNPKRKASVANLTSPVNTLMRDIMRWETVENVEEEEL